ncbi:hypothetical protein CHS0354_039954, partial [Potamilus streckersoni]
LKDVSLPVLDDSLDGYEERTSTKGARQSRIASSPIHLSEQIMRKSDEDQILRNCARRRTYSGIEAEQQLKNKHSTANTCIAKLHKENGQSKIKSDKEVGQIKVEKTEKEMNEIFQLNWTNRH